MWKNKVIGTYSKEKVYFIGIDELITTRRLFSRQEDKIDLDLLLKAKNKGIE